MERCIFKAPCGCEVSFGVGATSDGEHVLIDHQSARWIYCALHGAAEEMRDALQALGRAVETPVAVGRFACCNGWHGNGQHEPHCALAPALYNATRKEREDYKAQFDFLRKPPP